MDSVQKDPGRGSRIWESGTMMNQGPLKQIAFRLPKLLLKRIDAHVIRIRSRYPGLIVSRSDAVRALLEGALLEAESGKDKPR